MKTYDDAISFENLLQGLKKSQRNVMWKDSVAGYSLDALKNTYKLRQDLLNSTYRISKYQVFCVHEPKEREIIATRIRDRQYQRSLCDNVLYESVTRGFIHDNCACQRGKGVDFALNRLDAHLHRYYRKHGASGYVLKCDIHHFFPETPHDTAKSAIRKRVADERSYRAVCEIIDSFGEKGIGLGSQVSQLIELAVLDDIDHYIKEQLHVEHYIRYMDDFLLISDSREYLKMCLEKIRTEVEKLGLSLNDKTQIYPLRNGITFLKWRFILTDSGKVIRRMSDASITRERRKLKKIAVKVSRGELPLQRLDESFQSWRANAMRGNTRGAVSKMTQLYHELRKAATHGCDP